MSYDVTPRKLWEWGLLTDEQLWRATTAAERDQIVADAIYEGRLSLYDEEYYRYYNEEIVNGPPRFDPREWSQEGQEKLSFYDPYDPNYE